MFEREQFHWLVQIVSAETGEIQEVENYCYWSPDKQNERSVDPATEIALASAAAYNTFNDRRKTKDGRWLWQPVTAVPVKESNAKS